MASCGTCARETHDEPVIRDPNFKYIQGDVYSLKESVYTPIYDILLHTFSKLDDQSDALRRTQQSLDKLTRTIKGGRPAVIMKDGGDDRQGLMVCVATTYKGEDISKLPLIFRHFSIFIEPNHLPSPSPDHTSHIHALPEWDKENAYIIAWRFPSKATRECVWTAQADGDSKEVRQVFGRHAMEYLVAECTKRKEQWEEMCKDPAMALKLESELRVSAARSIQVDSADPCFSETRQRPPEGETRLCESSTTLLDHHRRAHQPGTTERYRKQGFHFIPQLAGLGDRRSVLAARHERTDDSRRARGQCRPGSDGTPTGTLALEGNVVLRIDIV